MTVGEAVAISHHFEWVWYQSGQTASWRRYRNLGRALLAQWNKSGIGLMKVIYLQGTDSQKPFALIRKAMITVVYLYATSQLFQIPPKRCS